MKRQLLAGAALGGIGLAAAGTELLSRRAGDLDPPLSRPPETYRWRGFDVSYTEGGDPSNPDLVLVHGINASATSHEFRDLFEGLTDDHHVLAPDLPGFGLTDRPPLMYSGPLYTTFLRDFFEDVAETPTVVAASLGGAYASVAAQSVDVEELLLVCPTATTLPGRRPWLRSVVRAPLLGTGFYYAITSERAIRYFNADHGYHDPEKITDELVDYQWQTSHQPGARFAPASFIAGFLDLDVDLGSVLADVDAPVTLVWGREAEISPLSDGEALADASDARLLVFDEAGIQPHVEHPELFVQKVIHGESLNRGSATDIEIESPNEEDATAEDQ